MILYGQLQSKANSRRLVVNRKTGRAMFIKSKEALSAVDTFSAQAKAQWEGEPIEGPVLFVAHVYYPSRRQDLDVSLLMDVLQGIAYHNDRQIERMALSKNISDKGQGRKRALRRATAFLEHNTKEEERMHGIDRRFIIGLFIGLIGIYEKDEAKKAEAQKFLRELEAP